MKPKLSEPKNLVPSRLLQIDHPPPPSPFRSDRSTPDRSRNPPPADLSYPYQRVLPSRTSAVVGSRPGDPPHPQPAAATASCDHRCEMPGNIATLLGLGKSAASRTAPWRRRGRGSAETEGQSEEGAEEEAAIVTETDSERTDLWALRKLIRERPGAFVLNNLILSIQLFTDYEK